MNATDKPLTTLEVVRIEEKPLRIVRGRFIEENYPQRTVLKARRRS